MHSLREHALAPTAPPEGRGWAAFVYGAAQPLLGLRLLARHRSLAWRALVPALIVLAIAVLVTVLDHEEGDGVRELARRYYAIVTTAASIPSVIFANSYARLAADAHARLGFGERAPLLTRLWSRLVHAARAAMLITIAIAPLLPILRRVPGAADALIFAATGMWTLHWIVVEALDNARVAGDAVPPSGTPWFVAWAVAPVVQRIPLVRRPLGWFARMVTRLSRPWSEETAMVARHPGIALGMGATAALILAVPIANLLLRPAVLIGAVHLRARWSGKDAEREQEAAQDGQDRGGAHDEPVHPGG